MNSLVPSSNDFYSLLPILILTISAILFLVLPLIVSSKNHILIQALAIVSVLVAFYFNFNLTEYVPVGKYFNGQIKVDPSSIYLNNIYLLFTLIFLIAGPKALTKLHIAFSEFYPLLLFATVGMMFMASGNDLLVLFLGIEILSISLYILIGLGRTVISSLEGALKYFLLGAFSSGFLLLGIAFLFGSSGSTNLELSLQELHTNGYLSNYSRIGLGFFLVGLFFKIGLVPFHSWAPDVYEGSPSPLSGFMSSAVKYAALALLLVFFAKILNGPKKEFWIHVTGLLAFLSMTFGNIIALRQQSLKRILAYSSIAHSGYVAAGIVSGAYVEVFYYLVFYGLASFLAFLLISYLESEKSQLGLESIHGLFLSHPFVSIGLTVCFLSLASLPPFGGFWSKLFLFQKLAETNTDFSIFLLVSGVINSAIAFLYYFRIPIAIFMSNSSEGSKEKFPLDNGLLFVGFLIVLFLLLGSFYFSPNDILTK